jgi:glutamyl-tRNA synthetase
MSQENKKIITRMAPSPTGKFHVGGVRTALYNFLFARKHDGVFIVRSEDTDKERSRQEYEDDMLHTFAWLGLQYDEFYRQSERTDIYKEHIQKLIDGGFAYEAEPSESTGNPVVRFKNPNKTITFQDMVVGEVSVDTEDLGDFVIARDIETPLYHLTVVVDDGLMEVSHVIRGQEHLANTPRQILILEALGFERPTYAHIPLILSPRGGKLSKRDPEVIPALEYQNEGILPQALVNFLALIGWNPGGEQEIFLLNDLIRLFDLEKVQKGGGTFNIEKLHWVNRQHILILDEANQKKTIQEWLPVEFDSVVFDKLFPMILERISTWKDVVHMAENGEFDFYKKDPEYVADSLIWKKGTQEDAVKHLTYLRDMFSGAEDAVFVSEESVKASVWEYAEEHGRGDVLWPLRFALSGKDRSPNPFYLCYVLGRDNIVRRLESAILLLEK